MITMRQLGTRLAAAGAAAALMACMRGEQASRSADSTARNLTLAPTESTAAIRDVPAPAAEPAKPVAEKAEKKVPRPAAKPPAPTTLTAPAGTRVPLAAGDTISTRSAKAGDGFSATV